MVSVLKQNTLKNKFSSVVWISMSYFIYCCYKRLGYLLAGLSLIKSKVLYSQSLWALDFWKMSKITACDMRCNWLASACYSHVTSAGEPCALHNNFTVVLSCSPEIWAHASLHPFTVNCKFTVSSSSASVCFFHWVFKCK